MKKGACMLRAHEPLILNWFRGRGEISTGAVEGLYNKIRVVTRRSYTGFEPSRRWKFLSITPVSEATRLRISSLCLMNLERLWKKPSSGFCLPETESRIRPTRRGFSHRPEPLCLLRCLLDAHPKMRDLTPFAVLRRGMGPPKRGGPWAAKRSRF